MSKWKKEHDDQLHRLFSYIHSTLDMHQIGYVGDKIEDIELTLFADADFAGNKMNSHSTSGIHLAMMGPSLNSALSGISKVRHVFAILHRWPRW